ncbi:FAD-dependent oxidoreductase [Salipaludibacillus sp. CUR1]|uniref:oxidoreductase n=1 Tax=Salipaludibacillus sp. CUR1 TaxID=2820003 RepID=UPI001E5D1BB0|nr:FAD-dependent oxidoreductase [Salipaludibacillus sp. CUR1]MCE7791793.1 FAD-dependent oxidoreductase [Salipaludibacillus sp. CUR1]
MSNLFTPISIGNLQIKNRFMLAPMENGLAEIGGDVNERIITFFAERAKNEVGIIMTGSVAVSPEGRGLPTQLCSYKDDSVAQLKKLTEAVHKEGAKIGAQIYHAGRQATEAVTGIQPIAPTALPCPILNNNPREMTVEEISEMVTKFREGARRCVEAGFDLIEVHFAHGYLLHSFLSPHSNHRSDEYGGSLENRMTFPFQVLKEIIEECAGKAEVTIRISADEYLENGLKYEEVKEICKEAEKAGASAISLTAGSYDSVEYTIQPMFVHQGFIVPFSEEIKKIVSIPVIVAGRLNNSALMEDIIGQGQADILAIGRGLISDEELVVKMKEKNYNDIRLCVACNQGCIDRVFMGQGVGCLVNARAGYEGERNISPSETKKKVVIIGAGPAGLEAARVASLKGHDVVVIDKEETAGGKFEILASPPEKESFLLYKNYLNHQFEKHGVTLINKHIESAEDLQEFTPDAVIIATGARQVMPPIKGVDSPNVILAEDVLRENAHLGESIAVIGGGLVGTETAKFLASKGKNVTIIEALDTIGKDVGPTFQGHMFSYLKQKGVELKTNSTVVEITSQHVQLEDGRIMADNVVIAAGYQPNNELADKMHNKFAEVYTIGDAKQPRRITDATEEGFLTANEI